MPRQQGRGRAELDLTLQPRHRQVYTYIATCVPPLCVSRGDNFPLVATRRPRRPHSRALMMWGSRPHCARAVPPGSLRLVGPQRRGPYDPQGRSAWTWRSAYIPPASYSSGALRGRKLHVCPCLCLTDHARIPFQGSVPRG